MEDLQKGLYESFHINFSEPLSRSLLEELAASVARDGTEELVSEVCWLCGVCFKMELTFITGRRSILVIHRAIRITLLFTSTACTNSDAITNTWSTRAVYPFIVLRHPQLSGLI